MVSNFVYKCDKGRISVCEDWFRPNRNIYNAHSSLGDSLFVPQYLVSILGNQFCIEDLKFIMMVPMEIKSLNNPESFKYNLKKSLLLQYV